MSCELCRIRPAKYRVKTGMGTAELCDDCHQRYLYLLGIGEIDSLGDMFDMYMFDDYNPITAYIQRKSIVCPNCGWSIDDVVEEYKLGCSNCYDYFSDKVGEYFTKLQGEEYKGKYFGYEGKSKGRRLSQMTVKDIPFLKIKLNEALERGEKEKAGAIERRIAQLQGGKI